MLNKDFNILISSIWHQLYQDRESRPKLSPIVNLLTFEMLFDISVIYYKTISSFKPFSSTIKTISVQFSFLQDLILFI